MQGVMDGMTGGAMMWGRGLFWLLGLVVLVLAVGALINICFSTAETSRQLFAAGVTL